MRVEKASVLRLSGQCVTVKGFGLNGASVSEVSAVMVKQFTTSAKGPGIWWLWGCLDLRFRDSGSQVRCSIQGLEIT